MEKINIRAYIQPDGFWNGITSDKIGKAKPSEEVKRKISETLKGEKYL